MHVRLRHVKPIRKRLASGDVATYYYHRITGKRIHGVPGTAEFLTNYEFAKRCEAQVSKDTFSALILAFRSSPKFFNLAPRTRQDYEGHLDKIAEKFGSAPIAALEDHRIRKDFMQWRDDRAKSSLKQADYGLTVLRLTLQWAYDQGLISINHATRGGRLYAPDRSDNIWMDGQIDAFIRSAHDTMKQALLLALNTGQREGDLLALPWTSYDGEAVQLRQNKGGRRVYIPCTAELRAMLNRMPKRATTILTNQRGLPWTESGFRTMFGRAQTSAGISDVTFHDLRGTFVTRMWERGAEVAEIAAITGHSLSDVSNILDAYTARTARLAKSGMRKYERGTKNGNRPGNRPKVVSAK